MKNNWKIMAISIGLVVCSSAIGVGVNVADSSSSADHIVIQAFDQNPAGIESNRLPDFQTI